MLEAGSHEQSIWVGEVIDSMDANGRHFEKF
jgi:hypothetical protein